MCKEGWLCCLNFFGKLGLGYVGVLKGVGDTYWIPMFNWKKYGFFHFGTQKINEYAENSA